jgi:DNA polymerase III delta prime subunit
MTFQRPAAGTHGLGHPLWPRLGFHDDPYYVEALPVEDEALELFVGREADRERVRAFLRHASTGKTMIQGPPGVGKTSLVNVVQQELFGSSERCPLLTVVEVPADQTREGFLLTVISAVVFTLGQLFDAKELQSHTAYIRAREAVTQTVRSGTDLGFSAALPGGAGGGLSASRAPVPTAPLATTTPALLELLLGQLSVVHHLGFEGLIVPVNNLDTLSAAQAAAFLNATRDITSGNATPGIHWMFIAGPGLFEHLEREHRRISESFTNNPVTLGPLSWEDVEAALQRRRVRFAIDRDTPLPISLAMSREVYDAGGGELRFTMVRLSRTAREFAAAYPSEREVPDAIARRLLADWGRNQLGNINLTQNEQAVIAYLRDNSSIRARDFAAVGLNTSQRLSQVLRDLVQKRYVKGGGASAPYELTAPARFAMTAG